MHKVAADIGYGYVKVISEGGGRTIFPSAVTPAPGSGDLAAALGGGPVRHRLSLQLAAGPAPSEYLVGSVALTAGASRSWVASGAGREDYLLLVLAALAATGAEGRVELALGLPLSLYLARDERRALRDRVTDLAAWCSWDGSDARRLEVASVRIMPQAAGAYYTALLGPDGGRLAGQLVGVIDVGYRTTDYLLLTPSEGGAALPDEARSGSVEAGMSQVIDAVRADVSARSGVPFSPPEGMVETTLENGGRLTVRGRTVDLRPTYDNAVRSLSGRIEAEIRRAWGERIDYLSALLIAGGGGAAITARMVLPAARLVPDPTFANAAGFLAMLSGAQSRLQSGAPVR